MKKTKIDLDALAAELTAAGYKPDVRLTFHTDSLMTIIRRHVAPAPPAPEFCPCGHPAHAHEAGVPCMAEGTTEPDAPDAGLLRERIYDLLYERGEEIDWSSTSTFAEGEAHRRDWCGESADAILAVLPPRIDGVLVPRELAEEAADLIYHDGCDPEWFSEGGPDRKRATVANKLRALLGREGV